MEVEKAVELERAKIRNTILEKQNEILMGTISILCNEKEALIKQIEEQKIINSIEPEKNSNIIDRIKKRIK